MVPGEFVVQLTNSAADPTRAAAALSKWRIALIYPRSRPIQPSQTLSGGHSVHSYVVSLPQGPGTNNTPRQTLASRTAKRSDMTDPKGWPTSQWLVIATLVVIF